MRTCLDAAEWREALKCCSNQISMA